MNEHLTGQIVAAMLRDGSVRLEEHRLREKVQEAVDSLGKEYVFKGIVQPNRSPAGIFHPTAVVAVTGGTYPGYSSLVIDKFTAALFLTDDGGEWTKLDIYNLIEEKIATPVVDFDNLPTLGSITGQEKVIVEKNGQTGLVTLTQIRQVVLPGYTFEDLTMDKFQLLDGGIEINNRFGRNSYLKRIEIPVPHKNAVFVIKCVSGLATEYNRFCFTTDSLESLASGDVLPLAGEPNEQGVYLAKLNEIYTIVAPDNAALLVANAYAPYQAIGRAIEWEIQVGELIINTRLNDLETRIQTLEQSPAPANISVSREEFDELKKELAAMKESTN